MRKRTSKKRPKKTRNVQAFEPIIAPRGRLLHVAEAAARIGIGYDALCRVISAGGIAVLRHDSGRLRGIYERDCDEWVEAHRCAASGDRQEPSRQATRDVDRQVNELLTDEERQLFE